MAWTMGEAPEKERAKLKNSGANGDQIARLEQVGMTWDIPTAKSLHQGERMVQVG